MQPTAGELSVLFDLLGREAPELIPICRWLIVGPELSAAILAEHCRPPTAAELTTLVRLLEHRAPDLVASGLWLVEVSEHTEAVQVELQLDRLIAADIDAWEYPTQALDRPLPDFERMLAALILRRQRARGAKREHLERVEAKLERAVRISESARRRRQRMRKQRRK